MEFNQTNNNARAWMGPEPLQVEELRQACQVALNWILWVRGSDYGGIGHQPPPEQGGDEVVRILKKALRKEGK